MANKKKRPLWMEEAAQKPTSGTPYANRRNEQEARSTSKQRAVQTVSKMTQRGTGSQTTSTGRSTSSTSNGVEILQAAQRQLNGTPYTPSTSVPALNVPGGRTMTPQERVELVRSTEERRKQKEKEAAATLGNDKIGEDMRQELKERKEAEKVTFSDFLADPLYAISAKAAPIGRDIEGAARMIFKPGEHAEREKRRANYNASLEAPQKADTGRALQGVLQQGIDEAGTGLVSTADFILGAPLRAAGWEDNPLHKFNEAAQASKAATQEYYAKNMENASGAAKTAENLGVQAVAAVPDLVLAYFTAGGSTGAGALARGGTRLAGREAALAGAEAVSKRAGTTQLARDVARSSAKNPMFWTSFARTTGNSYEQAKAQGASDWEASMYAIVNGVLNSQVEAGSGVQALPTELQKGGSAALAFLRSAVEEGNEEVVQGVIERSLQNLTYDADNALVSTSDENAIFNPVTAAKEWGSGAAVGGILGLPGTIVQGGRNMRSDRQASAEADARMAEAERQRRAADVRAETREPATVGAPVSAGLQTLQNAAESLRTNGTAQDGNLPANAESTATQDVTGQIRPQTENAARSFAPEDHIDNRTDDYISKTSTKAFQHEHPELHDHFAGIAQRIMEEAMVSIDRGVTHVSKKNGGGARTYYDAGLKKVIERSGLSRNQVIKVCQDIINDRGSENYADAKRVEQALDSLMSGSGEYADAEYKRKKGEITGGTQAGSFNEYLKENELSLALGEVTKQELKDEWEALQAQRAAEATEAGANDAQTEPTALELKTALEEQVGRPLTMADLDGLSNQELADRIRPAVEQGVPTRADAASVKEYAWNLFQEAQDAQERWIRGRDRNPNIKRYPAEITQIARENNITEREVLDALRDIASGNTGGGVYQSVSKMTGGVPTDTNGLPEGQGAASANFATTPENVDYNTWSENAAEVYPVGENARRDAQLPTENPQGQRTMRGGRGVMEWEGTPEFRAEQIGQLYADGNLAYEPTTNAELAQTAEQTVEQNGWLATYNDWSQRVGNNELSPELVATGAALLNGAGQSQQISTGDYLTLVSQYVELLHRAGQSLQAARVLKRLTPEARLFMMQRDIDAELDGHNMTDEQRQEARASTMDFAREWANMNMQGGNPEELVSLIRRLNAARMTGGLFTPRRMSGTMERTINSVLEQEGGYEFLYSLAGQQIHNLATDHAPRSGLEITKSLRYMAMLSKLNTVMRNLVGNNVFDPIESLSTNIGILPDLLMSMFTHQRTTGFDSSWLSAAKRRGSAEGMQRAYLAAALDADPGEGTNRWEQSNRRTFRMDRSLLERFFSTIEKWQQYELYVTDEMQKGGIRAAAQDRIDRLTQRGLLQEGALDGWAEEQARQRTFQNEGTVAGMMEGARDLANGRGRFVLRDRNGGTLGVGDALVPFARVPGNVVGQFLNYTPAGLMRGMGELVNVLHRARNGTLTAQQQAQAALDVGRGLNGTGLLIALGALAARGLLNVADAGDDEDEKNLAKLRHSEGVTGTQWNLSATMRALNGGDEEWQDGDELMSIGFLEPLNGVMALAALMADDAEALEDSDVWGDAGITTSNTLEAAMQSIADLPAVTSLNNIVNAFRYSDAESFGGKAADAGVQLAGDFAGSFVPNALAGIAQGMDEGAVRQTRTSDRQGIPGTVENAWNNVLSKIPGVRSRLPQALDNWGQDRQTTATPLQNWFNTNVLPGAITRYQTNEVNQELYRLMESQDVKPPARSAIKEVSDGDKTRKLDNEDQRTYQEVSGQTAFRELQRLMDSAQYGRMRDGERAAAWNAIMTYGKAQGEQWVGGDRKTPSWATKSDGSTAENAAFYAILQAAKHRLDEDDRQKVAPVVEAIFNRRLDEQTQLGVLQQELNEKQIGRLQTAIGYGYEPKDIAAFWGYMNSVNGRKGDTRSWALQNGFTAADFNVLWKVFH